MEKAQLTYRTNLFKKFVGVDELRFHLPNRNETITRFVVTRPDAAAIVLYNKTNHTIVLIKQFRAPVFTKENNGIIWEIPAGVIEKDETASECIVREALEETGYKISNPKELSNFYPTCGLLNERIALFYSEVESKDKIESGGGLDSEHEYLEVIEVAVDEAIKMVMNGEIVDAKTMLGIFYLKSILQG